MKQFYRFSLQSVNSRTTLSTCEGENNPLSPEYTAVRAMISARSKHQLPTTILLAAIACTSCSTPAPERVDTTFSIPSYQSSLPPNDEARTNSQPPAASYRTAATQTRITKIDDPALSGQQLYQAWQAGDRPAALNNASATAVSRLFNHSKNLSNWQFRLCERRAGEYDCFYSFEGGGVTMRIAGQPTTGYRVQSVDFVTIPGGTSDPEIAAQQLYHAWKSGDRAAARQSASQAAVTALLKQPWHHPDWQFTGCENHAGGYDCFFYAQGNGLTMRVTGGASAGYWVESINFLTR